MKTIIQLEHSPERTFSGEVTFHDGQKLSFWPGEMHEVAAQIYCAMRLAITDLKTRKEGLTFKTMGHELLLQASALDEPRYVIDEILNEPNLGYALNWRLNHFSQYKLFIEERIAKAAIAFNQQMIAGMSWYLDNAYSLWIADAHKAFRAIKASPYVLLIEETISRLQFHGIDVSQENAMEKWASLTDRQERSLRSAFGTIDRKWWELWKTGATDFDAYLRSYITSNIQVFKRRSKNRISKSPEKTSSDVNKGR